jgi:sulfoxide reductase heme-binding subunit YedZ
MPLEAAVKQKSLRSWQPLGKAAVFALSLLPLANLGLDAFHSKLTANPIAEVMNRLGFWTLSFLVLSLAATPMKTLFGWTFQMRVRRMLGLFAFFYAALHFSTYLALDQGFDLSDIGEDIVKRKFITVGFVAFTLLIPLAVTSTDRAVKRLGFRRWKRIHRLIYAVAVLGVIHFVWRVKADLLQPALFGGVLAFLFAVRLVARRRKRSAASSAGQGARTGAEQYGANPTSPPARM